METSRERRRNKDAGREAHKAFHRLLLIFKEVLVDLVLGRSDLVLEHHISKHEKGEDIAEAKNLPSFK